VVRWTVTDPFLEGYVYISLNVVDGNQPEKPVISGNKTLIDYLKLYLRLSSGAFGHQISLDITTAIDMDAALRSSNNPFDIEITEGRGIVASYDPGIPEGDDT